MTAKFRINLWFDDQAEEAARFYTSIFKDSKLGGVTYYPEGGQDVTGKKPGSVMTVEFELNGERFIALNGGPQFQFNESISFEIVCADQAEVDYYWDSLSQGGDPSAQQCGWLKDRYGVAWQVVPGEFAEMINDPDKAKVERVFMAMLQMKKLDLAALRQAFEG